MPGAARLNDPIQGTTSSEHNGHTEPPHGPLSITGNISGGCSSNVNINGMQAAMVNSTTVERDECCGSSNGSVGQGSSRVFINGRAAARNGDRINAHNGTATISGGSSNVIIG